jgi:MoxR-like ATPase
MQEHRVTVSTTSYTLDEPFFVLATQNPLESEGTYPLPEAQLDRFFFKLHVTFPGREELHSILERTTGTDAHRASPVLTKETSWQAAAARPRGARRPPRAGLRGAAAPGHAPDEHDSLDMVKRFVKFGSSPRGAQALLLGAKIRALFEGRFAPRSTTCAGRAARAAPPRAAQLRGRGRGRQDGRGASRRS